MCIQTPFLIGIPVVQMRHTKLCRLHTLALFHVLHILLFFLRLQRAVGGYYPQLTGIAGQSAELAVGSGPRARPIAVAVPRSGGVAVLDMEQATLASKANDSTASQTTLVHRAPYCQVQCLHAVLVSYVHNATIGVFAHSAEAAVPDYSSAFLGYARGSVLISDICAAEESCAMLYILDGVHKKIYTLRPGEEATLFMDMAGTEVVSPTSIQVTRDGGTLVLADWGGASIYTVALSAPTPVLARAAGSGVPQKLVDGVGPAATLSGPTQLALYRGSLGVLFTDRNPALNTSAVRLLRMDDSAFRGSVLTLAGGNSRGASWGQLGATHMAGIWDIAFDETTDTVYVTEPLTGRITALRGLVPAWASCDAGFFKVQALAGECDPCEAGAYCPGSDVSLACGEGRTSAAGSADEGACVCENGFFASADTAAATCVQCPADHYCQRNTRTPTACPLSTHADAGSTSLDDCKCDTGMLFQQGECVWCPSNFFCESPTTPPQPCTANAVSALGSSREGDCKCAPGYKRDAGQTQCRECVSGQEVCSGTATSVNTVIEITLPANLNAAALIEVEALKNGLNVALGSPVWLPPENMAVQIPSTTLSPGRRRALLASDVNETTWYIVTESQFSDEDKGKHCCGTAGMDDQNLTRCVYVRVCVCCVCCASASMCMRHGTEMIQTYIDKIKQLLRQNSSEGSGGTAPVSFTGLIVQASAGTYILFLVRPCVSFDAAFVVPGTRTHSPNFRLDGPGITGSNICVHPERVKCNRVCPRCTAGRHAMPMFTRVWWPKPRIVCSLQSGVVQVRHQRAVCPVPREGYHHASRQQKQRRLQM